MITNSGTTGRSLTLHRTATCGNEFQYVEEQAPRIKRQQIETLDCMGFNAWELPVTLENDVVALAYPLPQEEETLGR